MGQIFGHGQIFADYVAFIVSFALATSFVSWIFSWSSIFAEILGSTLTIKPSFCTTACSQLGKTVYRGFPCDDDYVSGGDFLKLTYFTASQVPIQFVLCAVVQCLIDVISLFQIFIIVATTTDKKPVPAARRLSRMIRSGLLQRRNKGACKVNRSSQNGWRERLPTNFGGRGCG